MVNERHNWKYLVFSPPYFIELGERGVTSYIRNKSNLYDKNMLSSKINYFPSPTKWTKFFGIYGAHTCPVTNP